MVGGDRKKGYTLIELSLAMAVVSVLVLAIAITINNVLVTYERGNTLNKINTVGMDIVDDMRTAVQNSDSESLIRQCRIYYGEGSKCEENNGYKFVYVEKKANVEGVGNNVPVYGAFCTGSYSYIWNSGYFDMRKVQGGVSRATYDGYSGDFRLLKVKDSDRGICKTTARWKDNSGNFVTGYKTNLNYINPNFTNSNTWKFNMVGYGSNDSNDPPIDLLKNEDSNLVLFDLFVAQPAQSATMNNIFYSVSFILGTATGGPNILANGQSCSPPSDYAKENFNYCAINRFNFAVEAIGG